MPLKVGKPVFELIVVEPLTLLVVVLVVDHLMLIGQQFVDLLTVETTELN